MFPHVYDCYFHTLHDRLCFLVWLPPQPGSILFPYTTLFRSWRAYAAAQQPDWPSSERAETIRAQLAAMPPRAARGSRSEEHTSELQSRVDLVCRLLLEKKNKKGWRCRW